MWSVLLEITAIIFHPQLSLILQDATDPTVDDGQSPFPPDASHAGDIRPLMQHKKARQFHFFLHSVLNCAVSLKLCHFEAGAILSSYISINGASFPALTRAFASRVERFGTRSSRISFSIHLSSAEADGGAVPRNAAKTGSVLGVK